jgi:hypothetical protein
MHQSTIRGCGRASPTDHINLGDGFRVLKPGNTRDRYLVSREGARSLVWRIYDHREYDDPLQPHRERPGLTAQQLKRDRLGKYKPFVGLHLY